MEKVLCVCTWGTSISPIMAALLQKELGDEYLVESAGSRNALPTPANSFIVEMMKKRGVDLTDHRSQWIVPAAPSQFGYIVCPDKDIAQWITWVISPGHNTKLIIADEAHGGIPDPCDNGNLAMYKDCLAHIEAVIPEIANQIRSEN